MRIGIVCSFINITLDFSSVFKTSVSKTSLLQRNIERPLFDILDVNIMS